MILINKCNLSIIFIMSLSFLSLEYCQPRDSYNQFACILLQAQCRKEARTLEKEIAHAEKRLEGVRKTLDERQEKVSDLQRSLNEAQRRQEVSSDATKFNF